MQEEKADITPIDELDEAVEALDEEPVKADVPEHMVLQPCRLPKVLMNPKELTQYEKDHGITYKERRVIEMTDTERKLYETYTGVLKQKRVTKEHFVTALRLINAGFDVWPDREKDLNAMKVH